MALGHGIEHAVCSTRECENPAEFLIEWSNPKIHTGRTKKWLACADHRQFLIDYLRYRNFPYEVSDFSDSPPPSDWQLHRLPADETPEYWPQKPPFRYLT